MTTLLGVNLTQRIGSTPLLRLERVTASLKDVQVLAKAEWTNPGGSVKDRAASRIVSEALRSGKLGAGISLLDSTSGNTGKMCIRDRLVASEALQPGKAHIVLNLTPNAPDDTNSIPFTSRKPLAAKGALSINGKAEGEAQFTNVNLSFSETRCV